MRILRQRKYLFALLALLVVFAGCKGESPTAPTTGTTGPGGSPGGGTTPPSGAVITLVTSNANPLAGSTTTVTATVSVNGNPAPNGTAVEFSTTPIGLFQDSGTNTTIRTTTNGVATVTLTAPNPGTATVTAVVNNVSRTIAVTFQARPVTPQPPDTAPAITAINPNQGRPEGGETVTITGRNFRGPVRVFFDFGNGVTREAIVTSATANQIQVLTPATDLGSGQTQNATIIIFTEQGTAAEQRITGAFTFRRASLTPRITTVSPDSGPINGGTRITIFGDGFEAPVQVSFSTDGTSWSQMQVLTTTFNQIIAVTPAASDVAGIGSGAILGPVDLRIININSATQVILADVFRYTPKMQITAVGPTEGPATGGTRVEIDGVGFDSPVAVEIGGVGAQVVSVSGTKIIAITSAVTIVGCADVTGRTRVVNIENGDFADGPDFRYRVAKPQIVNVRAADPANTELNPGEMVVIVVRNAPPGGLRFTLGDRTGFPSGETTLPNGDTAYTLVLPANFTFTTEPCTVGGVIGTRLAPLPVNVSFNSAATGCTDQATGALIVTPLDTTCRVAPPPVAQVLQPGGGACAVAAPVAAASGTSTVNVVVANNAPTGSQPLQVAASITAGQADFTAVTPSTSSIPGGSSTTFAVTFDPSAVGARTGTLTLTTNDPARPSITVCLQGTGQ